jgi:hypothetical protein
MDNRHQRFRVYQRRAARVLLEGIPGSGPHLGSRLCPQTIDLLTAFTIQSVSGLRIEYAIDLGTSSLCLFLDGREAW